MIAQQLLRFDYKSPLTLIGCIVQKKVKVTAYNLTLPTMQPNTCLIISKNIKLAVKSDQHRQTKSHDQINIIKSSYYGKPTFQYFQVTKDD